MGGGHKHFHHCCYVEGVHWAFFLSILNLSLFPSTQHQLLLTSETLKGFY